MLEEEDGKDDNQDEDKKEEAEDEQFSCIQEYQYEMDRHRIIVAMVISDFFLYILKKFKANHIG